MNNPTLMRLLGLLHPYRLLLVLSLACAVANVTLSLFAPVLVGRGIDRMVGAGQVDFDGLGKTALLLIVVILFAALFQWLMTLCTNRVAYRTVDRLRTDTFDRLAHSPLAYLDRNAHGDLISRVIGDIDQISDGLLQGFAQLFTGVITIVGTIGFMLSVNVTITLVVVVITPLSLFVASFIAKHCYDKFREQSAARGELGGFVEEMLGGQRVVKAFAYEKRAQEQFDEINGRLYNCGWLAQFYSSLANPSTRFVNGVVYAAVGITGALAAINGRLTVGQLTAFLTYANQYTKPFNEISGVVTELQSAFASAKRVFELLDAPMEPHDPRGAAVLDSDRVGGDVTLRDVAFSYHPKTPLIEGLNLATKSGQHVAIVGPTGCGKTTVINLLMRFYDADAGEILIDGQKIKSVTRASVRGSYGLVLQDTWLFSGTVRDNITYGKPAATDDEVTAAARAAHSHSFIKRLPDGYNTVISGDGGNLSQGQKQLLCIARVMLTHPPMLILDEATSSIDTRTEIRVQKAFAEMMRGRTSFIVAHRLSTIREADIILVMRDGHIVEQGAHTVLLAKGGFYANLYNAQFAIEDGA